MIGAGQRDQALRLRALLDRHPGVFVEAVERTGAAVFTDGEHVLILTDIVEREHRSVVSPHDAQRRDFLERWMRSRIDRHNSVRDWLLSHGRVLRLREQEGAQQ